MIVAIIAIVTGLLLAVGVALISVPSIDADTERIKQHEERNKKIAELQSERKVLLLEGRNEEADRLGRRIALLISLQR